MKLLQKGNFTIAWVYQNSCPKLSEEIQDCFPEETKFDFSYSR